jgi:hypothetical protein
MIAMVLPVPLANRFPELVTVPLTIKVPPLGEQSQRQGQLTSTRNRIIAVAPCGTAKYAWLRNPFYPHRQARTMTAKGRPCRAAVTCGVGRYLLRSKG